MAKRSRAKKLIIFFTLAVLLGIAVELYLRFYWGFCDSVLMMESDKYEYIAQPNQDRFRFRNHIQYNSFSMRAPEPDTTSDIILGFGDSVINGSVMVDQDSVVTTLLSKMLTRERNEKTQVLNISAGSWGPDNCYAYLKERGGFNAKMIFLIASSHDAYDNMDFREVVDHDRGYETKQYNLAIWELVDRYVVPKIFEPPVVSNETPGNNKERRFNSGFADLNNFAIENEIPFMIYLHPDSTELGRRAFNAQGLEIIRFCKENSIPLIWSFDLNKREDYRDIIHLKESGHRNMAEIIKPQVEELLKEVSL